MVEALLITKLLLSSLYVLIIVAFILMLRNYKTLNWLWLVLMVGGIFVGVGQYVALVYLIVFFMNKKNRSSAAGTPAVAAPAPGSGGGVVYHQDGSYTVYPAENAKNGPSPGRVAFRIVGGILSAVAISFGLLIVGVMLLFTLAPSIACGGSSKCY